MKLNVLFEDNHLIAVEKPAGVLTQGDKTGDVSLMDEVKSYLKEKYKKSGNVFLGLLHRLDRPVSGIILFAKTSKGASRLSEQIRNHEFGKTYHAIVIGKPQQEKGTLKNYLVKDARQKLRHFDGPAVIRRFGREKIIKAKVVEKGNGQFAELDYEVLESNGRYSLLKIQIKTGRFHQIRAQLSVFGFPILGDVKYGAPSPLPDKTIALSATSLSFQTATTKETKELFISIPKDWEKYISLGN